MGDGQLLGSGAIKIFANPRVTLTVHSADYSQHTWATVKRIYNVYVTTSEYDGATGQCSQGQLRRRLDTSDGIEFPSGDDVKVSKQQAKAACAHLREQKQNCETDLRMVNEPDAIAKITKDFDTVERPVQRLEATTTTNTATEASTSAKVTAATTTPTEDGVKIADAATTTHLCFSVLVMLIVSIL